MNVPDITYKSISLFIIAIFSFITRVNSQDIDRILVDGLILSYFLGENDFESIESYLEQHSYKFVPNDSRNADPNIQSYYKTINADETEGLTLILDMRQSVEGKNQYRVGISHTNAIKGSFFIQKLKKRLEDHQLFKKVEDVFMFVIPKDKEDLPKEPKDLTETLNYYSIIDMSH